MWVCAGDCLVSTGLSRRAGTLSKYPPCCTRALYRLHMQCQQNLHLRYHLWMTSLPPKRGMLQLDVHWHGICKWVHTWQYSVMFLLVCSLRSRMEFTRIGKPATVPSLFVPSWVSRFVAVYFTCVYVWQTAMKCCDSQISTAAGLCIYLDLVPLAVIRGDWWDL